MTMINMIGKPCPIPVVEARKVLSQPGTQGVIVLVDNSIAVQNLEKMAVGLGYGFSQEQKGETEYTVTILLEAPGGKSVAVSQSEPEAAPGGMTFLITSDQFGISAEDPAKKLMKNFLYSLAQSSAVPKTIVFVNAGVKLAAQGSEVLDDLGVIAGRGTNILCCGQCLSYYGLTDKLVAGKITNMLEIVEILASSTRTVTL